MIENNDSEKDVNINKDNNGGEQAFEKRFRELQERDVEKKLVPCHIYFWQQTADGMIKLGSTPVSEEGVLTAMRGVGNNRAHMLAVIPNSDLARLESIQRLFARFALSNIHDETQFAPDSKLINMIKSVAKEWDSD